MQTQEFLFNMWSMALSAALIINIISALVSPTSILISYWNDVKSLSKRQFLFGGAGTRL